MKFTVQLGPKTFTGKSLSDVKCLIRKAINDGLVKTSRTWPQHGLAFHKEGSKDQFITCWINMERASL